MNSEQYQPFYDLLHDDGLTSWLDGLPKQVNAALQAHGDYPKWAAAIDALPDLKPATIDLANELRIGSVADVDDAVRSALRSTLMQFHPWRKGPFSIYGLNLNTEWRSDWKWDRLKDAITPLTDRRVLDVGCGNGYHCWRMLGAGAKQVMGIDPTIVFVMQFWAIHKLLTAKTLRRQEEKTRRQEDGKPAVNNSQFSPFSFCNFATSQPRNGTPPWY